MSVNQITARLPLTRQNFHIDDTGTMYIIDTPGGINIKWYHSTGIMVLQYTAPDNTSTRGLCGQCVSVCDTLLNYDIEQDPTSFQYLWSYCAKIISACLCKRNKCFYYFSSKCKLFCWCNQVSWVEKNNQWYNIILLFTIQPNPDNIWILFSFILNILEAKWVFIFLRYL